MKNADTITSAPIAEAQETAVAVHPLKKQYTFISSKVLDYENLTALEAVAMTTVFVLAVFAGVLTSATMV